MNPSESLQTKLERLELLTEALLRQRDSLLEDLRSVSNRPDDGFREEADRERERSGRNVEEIRLRLAESEAANQRLLRQRDEAVQRLLRVKERLDSIEAKLLEHRAAAASNSRG